MCNNSTAFDIDDCQMQLELQRDINRDKLNKEKMCLTHTDVIMQYYSLNIASSCHGGSKTCTSYAECTKISQVDPHAHMLITACKAENNDYLIIDIFKLLTHISQ